MPLTGTKPKGEVRRRNKPTHDWTEVEAIPFEGGPKLPATKPGERTWPTGTKRWWKSVSRMPHCVLWDESDWMFALETALVNAAFHNGDIKAATELRNREKVLGTTVDFRRDLRIRYVDPAPKELPESVKAIDDYRKAVEE
jgi:hypothetical protein